MNNNTLIKIFLIIVLSPIIYLGQLEGFHSNLKANCKFCHVNEEENTNTTSLAWQAAPKNNSYKPYSSSTLDAQISKPLGSSKLCLSCHDGILAMEDISIPALNSNQIIGTNLRGSHPVSFKYDTQLAVQDAGLIDPESSPSGLGGTIHSDMLINGNLECISCHDIHGIRGVKNYLVKSNNRSKLCLTCHDK
jgi:predicted CXXCH cytochrome family protein